MEAAFARTIILQINVTYSSRFPDVITFRGNDAEMKVDGRGAARWRSTTQRHRRAFLKKGGTMVVHDGPWMPAIISTICFARRNTLRLIPLCPSASLNIHRARCTRAHTPLIRPNLVITYRFRVSFRYRHRYTPLFPLSIRRDKPFLATSTIDQPFVIRI